MIIVDCVSCYIPYIHMEMKNNFNQPVYTQMVLTTIVATGACYVAESLRGGMETEGEQVVIEDIIAHSLGILVADKNGNDVLSKIIDKGEVYPCQKSRPYTTTRDWQTVIPIDIYEAGADCEDKKEIENHDFYGNMELTDITAKKAGEVKINVTFAYDQSGCLTVTAEEDESGISKQIMIHKGEKAKVFSTKVMSADMVVLLDTSGSMDGSSMQAALEAYKTLVTDLVDLSQNRVALITYDNFAVKRAPLTHSLDELLLATNNVVACGGTEIYPALTEAKGLFEANASRKFVLIITDGYFDDDSRGRPLSEEMKANDITIICIGAGNGVYYNTLEGYASSGMVYTIKSMDELADTFRTISERIQLKE